MKFLLLVALSCMTVNTSAFAQSVNVIFQEGNKVSPYSIEMVKNEQQQDVSYVLKFNGKAVRNLGSENSWAYSLDKIKKLSDAQPGKVVWDKTFRVATTAAGAIVGGALDYLLIRVLPDNFTRTKLVAGWMFPVTLILGGIAGYKASHFFFISADEHLLVSLLTSSNLIDSKRDLILTNDPLETADLLDQALKSL